MHADGTFSQDWEYVVGSGDLDECNGIILDGTYAYFITEGYPYVPRCWNGESAVEGRSAILQTCNTVLALNVEAVGHSCWALQVYLLGI